MNAKAKIVHLICAARPNFMKIAPLYHVLRNEVDLDVKIVHTGQHYDVNMSDVFFHDLELPMPHLHLGVGSGTHAEQIGGVMIAYEKICVIERPELTVVVGDVNSTVACALVSTKLGIKTAHLEAGLRSFDRSMPEELNRIVTDSLSDVLWTPSIDGNENLLREGISPQRIQFVGNIMIDSLELIRPKLIPDEICHKFGLLPKEFALGTFHRPSNVDSSEMLELLCEVLGQISCEIPLICPLHPRTRSKLVENNLYEKLSSTHNLTIIDPLSYRDFISLLSVARAVLTDSGGVQEETTYLKIPCLTARENTERPITVSEGSNRLVSLAELPIRLHEILSVEQNTKIARPKLWDGKTAFRVRESILELLFPKTVDGIP